MIACRDKDANTDRGAQTDGTLRKRACSVIARLIAYVMLGLLTTVLVAWASALWVQVPNPQSDSPDMFVLGRRHPTWMVHHWKVATATRCVVMEEPWIRYLEGNVGPFDGPGDRFLEKYLATEAFEPWLTAWRLDPGRVRGMVEDARGWPCRALAASCESPISGMGYLTIPQALRPGPGLVVCLPRDGRILRSATTTGMIVTDLRILPLRPIWRGMIVDVCFYAALLYSANPGVGALKRWHRRRHGRCPVCAYDLRGQDPSSVVCPECGCAASPRHCGEGG